MLPGAQSSFAGLEDNDRDGPDPEYALRAFAELGGKTLFPARVNAENGLFDMDIFSLDGNSVEQVTHLHFDSTMRYHFTKVRGGIVFTANDQELFVLSLLGDLDGDEVRDASDIDLFTQSLRSNSADSYFDLNTDTVVDMADHQFLIETVLGTYFGDANLDGEFNSSDLVAIFEVGEYEDTILNNSGWADGDWNGGWRVLPQRTLCCPFRKVATSKDLTNDNRHRARAIL
ncbi:MAG: hypothetical protein R3C28_07155 [Pirellulaceae bacterium]